MAFMATKKDISTAIGIDLGTAYCCVGVWKDNTVEIIPNDMGERTTPSYVSFSDTERFIGTAAKNQCVRNPKNTVFNVMRLIGRKFDDPMLQSDIKLWPFKVIKESRNRPAVEIQYKAHKKILFPQEILAMLLVYLQKIAHDYIGTKPANSVLSVPVYYNTTQRQAVKDAAKIAGLNVLRIVSSPTLASIPYGLADQKYNSDEKLVLVFDLGAGTLNIALVSMDDGVFEVKAVAGNANLGGKDFDDILVNYCVGQFSEKHKLDCTQSERAMSRLRKQCERAKRTLSSAIRANIEIDCFYDDIDLFTTIGRELFEELCADGFDKCVGLIANMLANVGADCYRTTVAKTDIDEILLVGGSSRIPKIQQLLKTYFNGKASCKSINSDEAVAYGAAVQAAMLSGFEMGDAGDVLLLDVVPFAFGIGSSGKINLDMYTKTGSDADDDSKGDKGESQTRDGVSANGGDIFLEMIRSNQTIPCKANGLITTQEDNQSSVLIEVYEGAQALTKDNHFLASFELMFIPPAPKGYPQIDVAFDLDANGILSVTAKDKQNTTNSNKITIDSRRLTFSEQEIKRSMADMDEWKAEDEEKSKTIEARNELENSAYKMKNKLDTARVNNKNEIENAIKQTIEWIDCNPNAIRQQYEGKKIELENIWRGTKTGCNDEDTHGLIARLKQKNAELLSENAELKHKLAARDRKLNKLMDDYKELERKSKGKQSDNNSQFHCGKPFNEWNCKELQEWICGLSISERYKQIVLNNIVEMECSGKDLSSCESSQDILDSFDGINQSVAVVIYNGIHKLDNNESLLRYDEKTVAEWNKNDILEWIKSIGLSDQWENITLNAVKNGKFGGRDLKALKSNKDIAKLFGIQNPMLGSRLWKSLKKMK